MESHKEVFVMMNLKATRNIRHKSVYFLEAIENVHESHAVYMAAKCQNCDMMETGSDMILWADPILEPFLLNSGQISLRQQRKLTRK